LINTEEIVASALFLGDDNNRVELMIDYFTNTLSLTNDFQKIFPNYEITEAAGLNKEYQVIKRHQ
jgi:hypothetical protein